VRRRKGSQRREKYKESPETESECLRKGRRIFGKEGLLSDKPTAYEEDGKRRGTKENVVNRENPYSGTSNNTSKREGSLLHKKFNIEKDCPFQKSTGIIDLKGRSGGRSGKFVAFTFTFMRTGRKEE